MLYWSKQLGKKRSKRASKKERENENYLHFSSILYWKPLKKRINEIKDI